MGGGNNALKFVMVTSVLSVVLNITEAAFHIITTAHNAALEWTEARRMRGDFFAKDQDRLGGQHVEPCNRLSARMRILLCAENREQIRWQHPTRLAS